jgi:hypothetical protein
MRDLGYINKEVERPKNKIDNFIMKVERKYGKEK